MENEELAEGLDLMLRNRFKPVDLSYDLEPNMPAWPTDPRYGHVLYESYEYGDLACHYELIMGEHTGTHIDAPLHMIAGGGDISEMPPAKFFGRALTIDASALAMGSHGDGAGEKTVSCADLRRWETEHTPIRRDDIVLFRFGWGRFYGLRPDDNRFLKGWPGLSQEAAGYLAAKKTCAAGTDAMSLDAYDSDFSAHRTLLGSGIYILENLKNLEQLPAVSYIMMMPLKIRQGSGSPLRVLAFVPSENS